MALDQVRVDLNFDPEHQFLALGPGFHIFRCELRLVGHERDGCWNDQFRERVERQTRLCAQRDFPGESFVQVHVHVGIARIDDGQHPPALRQHFPRLSQAILHSAVARGFQDAVLEVRLNAFGFGDGRRDRGFGFSQLRLSLRGRCFGRFHRGLSAIIVLHGNIGLHVQGTGAIQIA